jgi:DNA repair exonuclease SbcCD ATPase subunit
MISKIKGIKFKGAAFEKETTLQLFSQEETDRVSVIFGRNGTGKSTISRAISKALDLGVTEDIETTQLVDFSNATISVSDDDKKRIFVFNEDYTNKNIRLQEEGLNTIVMFGDVADIAEKIEKATETLENAEKEHSAQQTKYAPYIDTSMVQSPDNQYEKVKNALKGDSLWAGRERVIFGGKANASVTDAIVKNIAENTLTPEETEKALSAAYDAKISELTAAQNAGAKITATIPTVLDYTIAFNKIKDLLEIEIEKPSLTEREKMLLLMAQSGKQSRLTEIKTEFSTNTTVCPFCLQPISDDYKCDLLSSMEKVLNKVAEQHKEKLESSKIIFVNMDFTAFEVADKETADNCKNAVEALNSKIHKCNQEIERKITNLYVPITSFANDLISSSNTLKERLSELETKKNEYNDLSGQVATIQSELKELNKKRAHFEIKDVYEDYLKQTAQYA